MTVHRPTVVVPVKPFAAAKTRLAPLLSPGQRAALSRRLCAHVLRTILAVEERADCIVVSRCDAVLAMAEDMGAFGLRESGDDLNGAVRQAMSRAPADRGVFVISSDLPLLDRSDVEALLRATTAPVVIATDLSGEGTNALYLYRPGVIDTHFGTRSHDAHRSAAQAAGLRCATLQLPGLAADLDVPEDLIRLRSGRGPGRFDPLY